MRLIYTTKNGRSPTNLTIFIQHVGLTIYSPTMLGQHFVGPTCWRPTKVYSDPNLPKFSRKLNRNAAGLVIILMSYMVNSLKLKYQI